MIAIGDRVRIDTAFGEQTGTVVGIEPPQVVIETERGKIVRKNQFHVWYEPTLDEVVSARDAIRDAWTPLEEWHRRNFQPAPLAIDDQLYTPVPTDWHYGG
jgi:hypothetical protein